MRSDVQVGVRDQQLKDWTNDIFTKLFLRPFPSETFLPHGRSETGRGRDGCVTRGTTGTRMKR